MKRQNLYSIVGCLLVALAIGVPVVSVAQSVMIVSDLSSACPEQTDIVVSLTNLDNDNDYVVRLERDSAGTRIFLDEEDLLSPTPPPSAQHPNQVTFTITPVVNWDGDDMVVLLIETNPGTDTLDTDSKAISVSANTSSVSIAASDTDICPGDNVTLNTNYSGAGTVRWYTNQNGSPFDSGTSISVNNITETTTYFARAEGACDSSAFGQITINVAQEPDDVAPLSKNPGSDICPGDEVTLEVSGNTRNSEQVAWYGDAGLNNQLFLGETLDTMLSQSSTFFARREHKECNNLNSDVEQISVTVVPAPLASILDEQGNDPDTVVACVGQTMLFLADTSMRTDDTDYDWSEQGDVDLDVSASEGAVLATFNKAELARIRLTADEGVSCTPEDDVIVVVLPVPDPSISLNPSEVCPGEQVTFSVQTEDNETYTWTYDGTTVIDASVTTDFSQPGEIIITVLAENEACNAGDTATLTVKPGPLATIVTDSGTVACSGLPLALEALDIDNPVGIQYAWSSTGGPDFSTQTGPSTEVTYGVEGTFEVRLVASAAGCEDRDTVEITAVETPDLLIDGVPAMDQMRIEVGELSSSLVELGSSLSGATISWILEVDSGDVANNFPQEGSGSIADTWELASGLNEAIIRVDISVSIGACSEVFTIFLVVKKLLSIPDIISPNGDGLNDTWAIQILEGAGNLNEYVVEVYHRQGACVLGCTQPLSLEEAVSRGWYDLADGPYFYIIRRENDDFMLSGPVTLVR